LTKDQKSYLENTCYFLTPVYLDYLESYTYNPEEVTLGQDRDHFFLKIKGPWYRTILWEVPLMAIISEAFFSMTGPVSISRKKIRATNLNKASVLSANKVKFADFGTRRRFSSAIHDMMISDILGHENHTLIGTSNVHFAQKFDITPIGTLAHEWFMFHAAMAGYHMANDVGVTPLNMVIKLSQCRISPGRPWQHTVKLSDDRGKQTGNRTELDTCTKILNLPKGPS